MDKNNCTQEMMDFLSKLEQDTMPAFWIGNGHKIPLSPEFDKNNNILVFSEDKDARYTLAIYPNIMEVAASYWIIDPDDKMSCYIEAYEEYLEAFDYKIKWLDFGSNPQVAYIYNPFEYIDEENELTDLIQMFLTQELKIDSVTVSGKIREKAEDLLTLCMKLLYRKKKKKASVSELYNIIPAIMKGSSMVGVDDNFKLLFQNLSKEDDLYKYYERYIHSENKTATVCYCKYAVGMFLDCFHDKDTIHLERTQEEPTFVSFRKDTALPDNVYHACVDLVLKQYLRLASKRRNSKYTLEIFWNDPVSVGDPKDSYLSKSLSTFKDFDINCMLFFENHKELSDYTEWKTIKDSCQYTISIPE